jgi:hypothetical protein
MLHRIFSLEYKDGTEFLDAHSQTRLQLKHLHVRNLLRPLSTAIPCPLPPPANKIFMPKLLKVAYPAAALMVVLAEGRTV